MASFCSGATRAIHAGADAAGSAGAPVSRRSTGVAVAPRMPSRRAMAPAVTGWSPVMSTGRIPALVAVGDAGRRPRAAGRRAPTSPSRRRRRLRAARPAGRPTAARRPRAPGSPARPAKLVGAARPRAAPGAGRRASGVEHRLGRALADHQHAPVGDAVRGRHPPAVRRRTGSSATRGQRPGGVGGSTPARAAQRPAARPRWGRRPRRHGRVVRRGRRRASLHRTPAPAAGPARRHRPRRHRSHHAPRRRSRGRSPRSRSPRRRPDGRDDHPPSVRVPVLSGRSR